MMNILLVSAKSPPAGGIATWTEKYLKFFENTKNRVFLVNIAVNGDRAKKINGRRNYFDEISRTGKILMNMCRNLSNHHIDIVHINSSCSKYGIFRDYLCMKMAQAKHIPVVLQLHCNVPDAIKLGTPKRLLRLAISSAQVVLVLNSKSYVIVKSIRSKRVYVVPNFIDDDWVVDNHDITPEIKHVIYDGHVQRTKGSVDIIEAAKYFPNIQFELIGPISDEINKMNIPENVDLTGERSPEYVKNQLRESDLFLFPSYTEGFSISLLEAMGQGLPVITTDVGANRDMIEDKGGIIISKCSPEEIISSINSLQDRNSRAEMSAWNINKVRTNYQTSSVMSRLVRLYAMVESQSNI